MVALTRHSGQSGHARRIGFVGELLTHLGLWNDLAYAYSKHRGCRVWAGFGWLSLSSGWADGGTVGHARKVMLSVFLTTKCNLHCVYCYTHNDLHTGQTIPWEFVKLGIDTFFTPEFPPHIRFFGPGEPTVELALMRQTVDYARERRPGEHVTTEIQTNGVFSEATAEYLASEFDLIWVSCDGLPDVQNHNRPTAAGGPSSPLLERNVKFLTEHGVGMTGIRTTITSENVDHQSELLEYFASLGVRHVWSDPVFPAIGEDPDSVDLDVMEYAHQFLANQERARSLGITYGSILTCNFDETVTYQCRACLPTPHLTTDGYVSACDMALFGHDENHMSPFIYGMWDSEKSTIRIDHDKVRTLQNRCVSNMPGCAGCPSADRCGGFCLGEVTNESGSMYGKKPRVCDPIRYLDERMPRGSVHYEYLHP